MRGNRLLAGAVVLTLGLAVTSAAVVWAQAKTAGQGNGFGFRPAIALNRIARQLNLTADQKQQIKDIVKARRDEIKSLLDEAFADRKALRQAIAAGNNDQIASAVKQLSSVELKGAELRAQVRAKIFSDVLQPDQRTRAEQLSAQIDQRAGRVRERIERFLDSL